MWRMEVTHRDAIFHGGLNNVSYYHSLLHKLKRDSTRVRALNRRVEMKLNKAEDVKAVQDFGSDVISGMEEGSGEYFIRIAVGTPAREQFMVLDTGSDVVWIQCQPCHDCYDQADPIFDPSTSASFATVACASTLCGQLDNGDCEGARCRYQVSYGDGSYTVGSFATETLVFGTTIVKNVAIGCGHDNEGLFVGAAGLLGLGAGRLSFPTQLGGYGKVFAYCLVDRDSSSAGTLELGAGAFPGEVYTPLLRNPRLETFYYVALTGITVGGLLVSLPPGVFGFDETGRGGVIIDSGTAVTRLQSDAYAAMRDAFVAGTAHLPRSEGVSIFDTCYDLSGRQSVSVPTVAFRFANGAELTLPAKNYLIPLDLMGTFCLAFAPTKGSISIIGNIQQQGIRISFDSANSLVGFAVNQC